MNKKFAESILAELTERHPAIQAEMQEMNSAHSVQWYQVWLWNEQTQQEAICLQSEGDWERFKLYRSLFAESEVRV